MHLENRPKRREYEKNHINRPDRTVQHHNSAI